MVRRDDGEIRQGIRIPPEQAKALREYLDTYGMTVSAAVRAGLDLLLDYCPTCRRPLDKP